MSYVSTFSYDPNTPRVDNVSAVRVDSPYWKTGTHLLATTGKPILFYVDRDSQADSSRFSLVNQSAARFPMSDTLQANINRALIYLSSILGREFQEVSDYAAANIAFLERETLPSPGVTSVINGKEVGVGGFASDRASTNTNPKYPSFGADIVISHRSNSSYRVVLHELGHAFGLEHPHESGDGDLHAALREGRFADTPDLPDSDYVMGYGWMGFNSRDEFNSSELQALQGLWSQATPEVISPKFSKRSNNFSGDVITGFDIDNDVAYLQKSDFPELRSSIINPRYAYSKKDVKRLARTKKEFIFDASSGSLFYNENGKQDGFGDGGMFLSFPGLDDFSSNCLVLI